MTNRLFLGATALALAAAAFASGPIAASPLRVTATRRVMTAGDNVKPFVVTRPRGGLYLAWAQRTGERTAAFFARSTDGVTFGAPVRISPDGMDLDLGAENGPQAAVDGKGNIYVVWVAGSWAATRSPSSAAHGSHAGHGHQGGPPRRPGNLNIYLVKSSDDGRTFSEPRQVNDGPNGPEHRFPAVAVDQQGVVSVVWLDKRKETPERPGFSRAYLARSTDGGKTFAPNVDVTERQENSICHCCKLAVTTHPTEGLFVAFRNDCSDRRDICLVRSPDGSRGMSPPAALEDTRWTISYCPMNGPSLAVEEAGNLHAVWSTGGKVNTRPLFGGEAASFKVLYRRFDARKHAWDAPICLGGGTHPRIAVTPDGVPFITWKGDCIMVVRLRPGARGTSPPLRLSLPTAAGAYPSLALGPDGALFVSWQQLERDGPSQIYVAQLAR